MGGWGDGGMGGWGDGEMGRWGDGEMGRLPHSKTLFHFAPESTHHPRSIHFWHVTYVLTAPFSTKSKIKNRHSTIPASPSAEVLPSGSIEDHSIPFDKYSDGYRLQLNNCKFHGS